MTDSSPVVTNKQPNKDIVRDSNSYGKVLTEHRIPTNEHDELSPVRLPLALVASLIELFIDTLENVSPCSARSLYYSPTEVQDAYSPEPLRF